MTFVQVCPVEIVNGSCPEPMVWREVASTLPLTYAQFLDITPMLVGVLFTAWGFKKLIQIFIK